MPWNVLSMPFSRRYSRTSMTVAPAARRPKGLRDDRSLRLIDLRALAILPAPVAWREIRERCDTTINGTTLLPPAVPLRSHVAVGVEGPLRASRRGELAGSSVASDLPYVSRDDRPACVLDATDDLDLHGEGVTRRSKKATTTTSASPASTICTAPKRPGRCSRGAPPDTSSSSKTSRSASPSCSQSCAYTLGLIGRRDELLPVAVTDARDAHNPDGTLGGRHGRGRTPSTGLHALDATPETCSRSPLFGVLLSYCIFTRRTTRRAAPRQACGIRDVWGEFERTGAVVLGVSPDKPSEHVKFREKYGLPFTLLSDTEHEVAEKYGTWVEKTHVRQDVHGHGALDLRDRRRRERRRRSCAT